MVKDAKERFWSKVKKTNSCWNWLGGIKKFGYGNFWFNGKTVIAHRFAYEITKGIIPKSKQLDHLCRNRKCVNPQHLDLVTAKENSLRGENYNRNKTHCKNGHKLSKNNLLKYPFKLGMRSCKKCHNQRNKLYNKKPKNKKRMMLYMRLYRGDKK